MKRFHLLYFLVFLSIVQSVGQITPQITNISARKTTSLNGVWRTIVDPFENGYYDYRRKPTADGYALDKDYTDKTTLQEYEFGTDKTLFVPGDWNTQRDELYYYEGTMWYRNRFKYDLPVGKRLFLYFGAVNYEAIVFLNGKLIGKHIGGFTPFNFEITEKLRAGENSLVVKVDNKRYAEAVPTNNSDWWNYGGITRSVNLVETPAVFIQDYYLQLAKNNPTKLELKVKLSEPIANRSVTLEIPELNIKKQFQTDSTGTIMAELQKVKPLLWSPELPKLYNVCLTLDAEVLKDEIGFRTLEVKGTDILLNGKKIFCRGICIHEEAAFSGGRAYSASQDAVLLNWAKELGCNFVRLAHYPHNEEMIRTAEKMGILVWSEIPVYWTIDWKNLATYQNAEDQLVSMIMRDKNRANVMVWSVANETPVSEARNIFLTKLISKARSIDPIRFVGAAMEKENINENTLSVKDPLAAQFDMISFNEYLGWYDGTPEKCNKMNWIFNAQKPVFISEFGGEGIYGMHGDKSIRFTEEYQEELYIKSIEMLKRIPALAGTTPWILKDFRSPRRQLPDIQADYNCKGLYSDHGGKKKAFYVVQKWYEELKNKN